MEQDKPVFIRTKEASKVLRAEPQTLCNWRCQGKGPRYYKINRMVVYSLHDLLSFAEARKIGTEDQPKEG